MRNIVNKVHEKTIRFNPRFAGGFAKHEVAKSVQYIDDIFRCANQSFPEGLLYENPEICTPEKTFNVFMDRAKKNDRKYVYDFARTDVFLAQFNLSYNGTPLAPIYLYLPFTNDAGMMTIRDKAFYIKPVVADPLISVSGDGLFLPLNQTKMTTRARSHYVYRDDRLVQIKILDTTIHHTLRDVQRKDNKEAKQRITTNAHYLFCKEGYKDTFLKYFNATVVAGYRDEITVQNYPKDEWVIYTSMEDRKFLQLSEEPEWQDHKVALAVKRSDVDKSVESVVGAFFYILDLLPDVEDINFLDDTAWWTIKMGKIILGIEEDHRILMKKMGSHFKAIDSYIDPMAINLMRDNDIYITDMYDYLAWLINNYDDYMNRPNSAPSTMYGKYLMVNRYIFQGIREAIFKAVYELRQKKPEKLTAKIIHTVLSGKLKPDLITKINNNFPNVSAVISSSDSKLLKMGIEMVPQDNMRQSKQEKQPKMLQNPKWQFDPSYIDVGGFSSMSKHEPLGKDTGNPKMNVGINGQIHPQEELADALAEVERNTRRIEEF